MTTSTKVALALAVIVACVALAVAVDWRALFGLLTLGGLRTIDRRRAARQQATEADREHRERSEARNRRVEALGRSRTRSEAEADAMVPAEDAEPLSAAERARRLRELEKRW